MTDGGWERPDAVRPFLVHVSGPPVSGGVLGDPDNREVAFMRFAALTNVQVVDSKTVEFTDVAPTSLDDPDRQ